MSVSVLIGGFRLRSSVNARVTPATNVIYGCISLLEAFSQVHFLDYYNIDNKTDKYDLKTLYLTVEKLTLFVRNTMTLSQR